MKQIKNMDSVKRVWCGQEIEPNSYYQIQPNELTTWANDSQLLIDIANGVAIVSNCEADILDVNTAINFLKDNLPSEVIARLDGVGTTSTLEAIRVAPVPVEGTSTLLVSHNFCDPTTWWGESIRVTGETLNTVSGYTYTSAHSNWIDLEHGKVMYEDRYASSYKPKIYVDGTLVTTGFTIDYSSGTVTFAESQLERVVSADYSYENGSAWIIAPDAGKTLCVSGAEVKFTSNVNMNTDQQVLFKVMVGSFTVGVVQYKSVRDFIVASSGQIVRTPALDCMSRDFYTMQFPYVTSKNLHYSQGLSIRVELNSRTPLIGDWAYMSASCLVVNE